MRYQFKAALHGFSDPPQQQRWIECVQYSTRVLPMPTGAIYVEKYFAGQPALDKVPLRVPAEEKGRVEGIRCGAWRRSSVRPSSGS